MKPPMTDAERKALAKVVEDLVVALQDSLYYIRSHSNAPHSESIGGLVNRSEAALAAGHKLLNEGAAMSNIGHDGTWARRNHEQAIRQDPQGC
jgi:hypothetical protein